MTDYGDYIELGGYLLASWVSGYASGFLILYIKKLGEHL